MDKSIETRLSLTAGRSLLWRSCVCVTNADGEEQVLAADGCASRGGFSGSSGWPCVCERVNSGSSVGVGVWRGEGSRQRQKICVFMLWWSTNGWITAIATPSPVWLLFYFFPSEKCSLSEKKSYGQTCGEFYFILHTFIAVSLQIYNLSCASSGNLTEGGCSKSFAFI